MALAAQPRVSRQSMNAIPPATRSATPLTHIGTAVPAAVMPTRKTIRARWATAINVRRSVAARAAGFMVTNPPGRGIAPALRALEQGRAGRHERDDAGAGRGDRRHHLAN